MTPTEAYNMGEEAFFMGLPPAPSLNEAFIALFATAAPKAKGDLARAYFAGWNRAKTNLHPLTATTETTEDAP